MADKENTTMNKILKLVRGDTLAFTAIFHDLGTDLDTAYFSVRTAPDANDYIFQKSLGDGITKAASGTYSVRCDPADTALLTNARYAYDFEIGIGSDVYTPLIGILAVEPDVTRGAAS